MAEGNNNVGLKKMVNGFRSKTPEHKCSNCRCTRYTPCTCMKSADKAEKSDKAENAEKV